ncbi:Ca2-binding protein [Aureococcus anophagefferens]|nr:Ca2-binding protein [Aureococcus anophagefferens]
MVDAVVYTADDFSRGPLDVAVALAPSSCAVDVRVVDAASGADLPLADFVCGDEHFGTRRGVLELAGSDLAAPRRVDALLDGYDDVDASRGRVLPVPGGVAPVVVRLRVFRVRLSARVDGGACAPALSRDGVAEAGVSLGVAYRVRCTRDGFRQRSLRDPVTFDVAHFDGCGAAALALVVELEAETFEAMVRVVDDASDALIPGAVVTIGGHEFAAAPGPRGYRHVGRRVPGTPGPSAFPHAVATCPGYLQTSPRRLELRNDGLAPCSTLRLRRAAVAVRVVDGDERAVPDPIVQLSLSARKRRPAAARRAARRAAVAVADAADAVRPRRSVLVVLGRSYDLRVVHESMRQRDLLDPQRFERLDFLRAGPLARAPGAPAAAPPPDPLTLTVHLEPYRCSIDLAVVDAFGDDLPDAQVKLGCYLVGTRRGVVDLDLTDRAVVGA